MADFTSLHLWLAVKRDCGFDMYTTGGSAVCFAPVLLYRLKPTGSILLWSVSVKVVHSHLLLNEAPGMCTWSARTYIESAVENYLYYGVEIRKLKKNLWTFLNSGLLHRASTIRYKYKPISICPQCRFKRFSELANFFLCLFDNTTFSFPANIILKEGTFSHDLFF